MAVTQIISGPNGEWIYKPILEVLPFIHRKPTMFEWIKFLNLQPKRYTKLYHKSKDFYWTCNLCGCKINKSSMGKPTGKAHKNINNHFLNNCVPFESARKMLQDLNGPYYFPDEFVMHLLQYPEDTELLNVVGKTNAADY